MCVCGGGGGGGGLGGKRAICDRVQLLLLAKACNHFLMCAVLSVLLSLSKSITFSKEGREWKVGGTVMCLGVHGQQGRAETFGGAGAQNIKGAHETRL